MFQLHFSRFRVHNENLISFMNVVIVNFSACAVVWSGGFCSLVNSIKLSLKVCCTTTLLHALLINIYLWIILCPTSSKNNFWSLCRKWLLCKWLAKLFFCFAFFVFNFSCMCQEHMCLWIKFLWVFWNLWVRLTCFRFVSPWKKVISRVSMLGRMHEKHKR